MWLRGTNDLFGRPNIAEEIVTNKNSWGSRFQDLGIDITVFRMEESEGVNFEVRT